MITYNDSFGFDPSERAILQRYEAACLANPNAGSGAWVMGCGTIEEMMAKAHPIQLESMRQSAVFYRNPAFAKLARRSFRETADPTASELFDKFVKVLRHDGRKGPFTGFVASGWEARMVLADCSADDERFYLIQDHKGMSPEMRVIVTPGHREFTRKRGAESLPFDAHMDEANAFIDEYDKGCNGYFVVDFAFIGGEFGVVEVNPFINFWPFGADMAKVIRSIG